MVDIKSMEHKKVQTVTIVDKRAVELINQRAARENRTAANAGTVTICEALGDLNDTPASDSVQEKKE